MSAPQSYVDISRTCRNSLKCLRHIKKFTQKACVNFCFKRDMEQVPYNVGFCRRSFGQIYQTDVWNKNWNLPRFLTTISRKIIGDIWNVWEKASGTKSSFSSISFHVAGFSKIDESGCLKYENKILDRKSYFRMFCQRISFVSFGFERSSFRLTKVDFIVWVSRVWRCHMRFLDENMLDLFS
jgi:hypothetical protein